MSPDPRVHPSAGAGFARAVADYERGRPDLPDDAVAFLVDELALTGGRTLLELGAGTGKLTRLLVPSGARIVAIEPLAAMREALARNVPGAEIVDAVAEELPLGDGSVDAAVAGHAFHWFDGPRAVAELARVLPSAERLALVWNVRDESVPWIRRITELIEPYRGDTPGHRSLRWQEAFDTSDVFGRLTMTPFPYVHETTREGCVARVLSISFVATLPHDERRRLADEVRRLAPGDDVSFAYRTEVWTTERA
jgi:SAM-dependent methyltransferase